MSHYYTDNKNLKSNPKTFEYVFDNEVFEFTTDHGVFSMDHVDYGTYVLIKAIYRKALGNKILDLGCGFGPIAIIIGRFHKDAMIDMVDVNTRALELCQANALQNCISATAYLTDNILSLNKQYNTVILNPPIRAGKSLIFDLYAKAYEVLEEDGHLYIVILKRQGAQSSLNKLLELFRSVQVIAKDGGYWVIEAQK